MANRQDSGSNSAHENQRPTSPNEDALPEMTDANDVRNRAEEDDSADEFDEADDSDEEQDEDDGRLLARPP